MTINAPVAKVKVRVDTVTKVKSDGEVTYKETYYVCQNCNFIHIDRSDTFCSRCGRRLIWQGIPK